MTTSKKFGATSNRGFTLVELLVVIAIIAILIGLLLPAVQATREAARVVQCKNHIKQLALASLNHENAHRELPGYAGERLSGQVTTDVGAVNTSMRGWNWITRILPFMEQESIAKEWGRINTNTSPVTTPVDREYIAKPVELLHCPSRRVARAYPTVGSTGNYYGGPAARTDYAMNGGAASPTSETEINVEKSGVWKIGEITRLRDVKDGTSTTYFIGEKSIEPDHYTTGESQGDYAPAFGSGPNLHATSSYVRFAAIPPRPDIQQKGRCASCHDFGSAHRSAMNMANLDGSVHSVSYNIDIRTFKSMATINGGEVVAE